MTKATRFTDKELHDVLRDGYDGTGEVHVYALARELLKARRALRYCRRNCGIGSAMEEVIDRALGAQRKGKK